MAEFGSLSAGAEGCGSCTRTGGRLGGSVVVDYGPEFFRALANYYECCTERVRRGGDCDMDRRLGDAGVDRVVAGGGGCIFPLWYGPVGSYDASGQAVVGSDRFRDGVDSVFAEVIERGEDFGGVAKEHCERTVFVERGRLGLAAAGCSGRPDGCIDVVDVAAGVDEDTGVSRGGGMGACSGQVGSGPEACGGGLGSVGMDRGRLGVVKEVSGCVARGVNYVKNKRKREKAKFRRAGGPGAGLPGKVPVIGTQGFFSGCDEKTRTELQSSRAKRLVAENLAAEAEALRKHRYLTSVAAYVQDFSKGMSAAKRLVKVTKDTEVGGWAETVSGSVAEALARSAPSSVPSLESVRLGSSSLESSAGEGSVVRRDSRLEEFRVKEAELREYFDSLEMVSMDDVDAAVEELRTEYADVLLSPKELAVKEVEKKVVDGVVCMDLTMEQKMRIVELVTL